MNNNNFNFPRILHLFWNGPLPFLNYLTVISFQKYHPNWIINVYTTKKSVIEAAWKSSEQARKIVCKNYMDELKKLKNVNILDVTYMCINHCIDKLNHVYQSDIIRIFFLKEIGGVWSDFDIIYIKNMEKIFSNYTKDIIFRVTGKNGYIYCPIGLLISKGNQTFYKDLYNRVMGVLKNDKQWYQKFGMDNYNKLLHINDAKKSVEMSKKYNCVYLGQEYYLPYQWNELELIFDTIDKTRIVENTVGIHWFNGADRSRKYVNYVEKIDPNNFKIKSTMDKLIAPYLKHKINSL